MALTVPGLCEAPLDYLEGSWALRRELSDHRLALEGSFQGTAWFEPASEGVLTYREEGLLEWPGYRGEASRSLLCRSIGPARVAFLFGDGRLFHDLELRPDGFEAAHDCAPDRYEGTFVLLGEDTWSATWRVSGPKKALVLHSRYRRVTS